MTNNKISIVYMLAASLLFAIMNVLVKYLQDIPVAQIVFMRSLVMFVLVAVMLLKQNIEPFGSHRKLLVARGLFGSLGIAFFFYSLHAMPLASAVVVHYLTPIFTVLISMVVAHTKLPWVQWLFFLLCLVGVFIVKDFDSRVETVPLFIAILGTIGAACAYNIISYLKDSEHHLVIMFYFPLVTLPLALVYILLTGDWVWTTHFNWVLLIAIGVLTYFAQYFLTKAYQLGDISKVSIISYLGIIYALFFGFYLFDEWYSPTVLVGLMLIVVGVIGNLAFRSNLTPK